MYWSTSVVLECIMKSAQRACFIEPREIHFLDKIRNRPVPNLCGVPAVSRIAPIRHKKDSAFVKMGLYVFWDSFV